MCGRITRHSPREQIEADFAIDQFEGSAPASRYNIPPSARIDTIRLQDGRRICAPMRWGFVPPFEAKQAPINARSETVATSPMFRGSFKRYRCLIPVDGFYEWRREGKFKVPFYIHMRSSRPFVLAGIWSPPREKSEALEPTCAILTCAPNSLMETIHNRMPVILSSDDASLWLSADTPTDVLVRLLVPFDAEQMEAYEVSKIVNSPANNSVECIQPVDPA